MFPYDTLSHYMLYFLDLFGTAVFAITGALAAGRKRMDVFGVLVLAMATAVGGGTIRDLVLGRAPVFWVHQPDYIVVILVSGALTFALARWLAAWGKLLVVADALGLAVFTVIGAQVALDARAPALVAVMMGVMTGAAGGLLRDVLLNEVPLILHREIYATAALAGAVLYVALARLGAAQGPNAALAASLVFLIRLGAIYWGLSLPVLKGERPEPPAER